MALAFFSLMSIAALTSSISMLEVPVSSLSERSGLSRQKAGLLVCTGVLLVTVLVILSFETLFGALITLTTKYAQPINSLLFSLYAGWLVSRHRKLTEISRGWPEAEHSLFWKIWPWYIRFACPTMIGFIILQSI